MENVRWIMEVNSFPHPFHLSQIVNSLNGKCKVDDGIGFLPILHLTSYISHLTSHISHLTSYILHHSTSPQTVTAPLSTLPQHSAQ